LQCAGKLAGHRLLDWSFYALIFVFPVIWYFLLGSWFKSQLGSFVSGVKRTTTWIGSHQPQEEEVITLQMSYQGQGQGQGSEVETSSITHCFGGTLLAQIKQESSMSGG
jgi:hypothetical protein